MNTDIQAFIEMLPGAQTEPGISVIVTSGGVSRRLIYDAETDTYTYEVAHV